MEITYKENTSCMVCGKKKWYVFLNVYGEEKLWGYVCSTHWKMIKIYKDGTKKNKGNYTKVVNVLKRKELERRLGGISDTTTESSGPR